MCVLYTVSFWPLSKFMYFFISIGSPTLGLNSTSLVCVFYFSPLLFCQLDPVDPLPFHQLQQVVLSEQLHYFLIRYTLFCYQLILELIIKISISLLFQALSLILHFQQLLQVFERVRLPALRPLVVWRQLAV